MKLSSLGTMFGAIGLGKRMDEARLVVRPCSATGMSSNSLTGGMRIGVIGRFDAVLPSSKSCFLELTSYFCLEGAASNSNGSLRGWWLGNVAAVEVSFSVYGEPTHTHVNLSLTLVPLSSDPTPSSRGSPWVFLVTNSHELVVLVILGPYRAPASRRSCEA